MKLNISTSLISFLIIVLLVDIRFSSQGYQAERDDDRSYPNSVAISGDKKHKGSPGVAIVGKGGKACNN
jgi:hypothetical protein